MSGILDTITADFQKAVAPFEPLSLAVEKHGCWEWSAGGRDELSRSVGLALTPRGHADKTRGIPAELEVEVWAGAESNEKFLRVTIASYKTLTKAIDPKAFSEWLLEHLQLAVKRARSLSQAELTDTYYEFPRTLRSA